jgi:hypothetical protein
LSRKKYAMVALAVASVLLGSLIVNKVILAQAGGEYDPWLDYNEDGVIDVNDLSPLGDAYGSQGDSTKNVSVTNWPAPQKPTFAEVLVLRGFAYDLVTDWRSWPPYGYAIEYAYILVDESIPYPFLGTPYNSTLLCDAVTVPSHWVRAPDRNFTFVPANSPFFIQGDVTIRTTLNYTFQSTASDVMHWNITVHLEKVTPETTVTLASDTITYNTIVDPLQSDTLDFLGVILNFPSPMLVETGERLQIRLETWVRSDNGYIEPGWIYLEHHLGTDEFIAYIPILQP